MQDRSAKIFGNVMPGKVVKKAAASKQKYIKKYGDDSNRDYGIEVVKNP